MSAATTAQFIDFLSAKLPDVANLKRDHDEFYDETIPHVFFGELTEWAQELAEKSPDSHVLRDLIKLIDEEWAVATPEVDNLIAVSFIENIDSHTVLVSLLTPRLRQVADSMGIEG